MCVDATDQQICRRKTESEENNGKEQAIVES